MQGAEKVDPQPTKMQDEQTLIESVLQGKTADVKRHVRQFPESADLVRDIEDLKQGLRAIEDEEPPLHGEVFLKKQKSSLLPGWLSFLPTDWYLNPFILGLGLVAFVWFLYVLIAFLLP
jgi:hypothetical protein